MQEDIRELRKKTIEKFAKAISDKLPGIKQDTALREAQNCEDKVYKKAEEESNRNKSESIKRFYSKQVVEEFKELSKKLEKHAAQSMQPKANQMNAQQQPQKYQQTSQQALPPQPMQISQSMQPSQQMQHSPQLNSQYPLNNQRKVNEYQSMPQNTNRMPNQGMQQPTQHPYHSMQGTSMDNLQHTQNTTVPNMSTADPNAQLFEKACTYIATHEMTPQLKLRYQQGLENPSIPERESIIFRDTIKIIELIEKKEYAELKRFDNYAKRVMELRGMLDKYAKQTLEKLTREIQQHPKFNEFKDRVLKDDKLRKYLILINCQPGDEKIRQIFQVRELTGLLKNMNMLLQNANAQKVQPKQEAMSNYSEPVQGQGTQQTQQIQQIQQPYYNMPAPMNNPMQNNQNSTFPPNTGIPTTEASHSHPLEKACNFIATHELTPQLKLRYQQILQNKTLQESQDIRNILKIIDHCEKKEYGELERFENVPKTIMTIRDTLEKFSKQSSEKLTRDIQQHPKFNDFKDRVLKDEKMRKYLVLINCQPGDEKIRQAIQVRELNNILKSLNAYQQNPNVNANVNSQQPKIDTTTPQRMKPGQAFPMQSNQFSNPTPTASYGTDTFHPDHHEQPPYRESPVSMVSAFPTQPTTTVTNAFPQPGPSNSMSQPPHQYPYSAPPQNLKPGPIPQKPLSNIPNTSQPQTTHVNPQFKRPEPDHVDPLASKNIGYGQKVVSSFPPRDMAPEMNPNNSHITHSRIPYESPELKKNDPKPVLTSNQPPYRNLGVEDYPKINGASATRIKKEPEVKFETICENVLRYLRDPHNSGFSNSLEQTISAEKKEFTIYPSSNSQNITPSSSHPLPIHSTHQPTSHLDPTTASQQSYSRLKAQQQPPQSYFQGNGQIQPTGSWNDMETTGPSDTHYSQADNSEDQYYKKQEPEKKIKYNPSPQEEKNAYEKLKQMLQMQISELKKKGYGYKVEQSESNRIINFSFFITNRPDWAVNILVPMTGEPYQVKVKSNPNFVPDEYLAACLKGRDLVKSVDAYFHPS